MGISRAGEENLGKKAGTSHIKASNANNKTLADPGLRPKTSREGGKGI